MATTPEPTADATLARILTRRERMNGPDDMTTANIDHHVDDEEADLLDFARIGSTGAKARALVALPFLASVQAVVTPG